jgi:transcriptional regulator with XRE-family HTH domain
MDLLTRQDAARRLYKLMIGKGWHQSELARKAGLSRDRVSSFVRGTALPDADEQRKLAAALDVEFDALSPGAVVSKVVPFRPRAPE